MVVGYGIAGAVITLQTSVSSRSFADHEARIAYNKLPEAGPGKGDVIVADPSVVGAVRINPKGDPSYLDKLNDYFYHNADRQTSPDLPIALDLVRRSHTSPLGPIPRTYIRCGKDQPVFPALQHLFIRKADAAGG